MKEFTGFQPNWRKNYHPLASVGLALLLLVMLGACNIPAISPGAETTPAAGTEAATTVANETPITVTTPSTEATFTTTGAISGTATASLTASATVSDTAVATLTAPVTSTLSPTVAATVSLTETATLTTPVSQATPAITSAATATLPLLPTATMTTARSALFVAIPPLESDMSDLTIGEIISTSEGFSSLTNVMEQTNLLTVVNGSGPLTLFAPTDNAFVNYPTDAIDRLMANPAVLADLLQYHIIVDSSPISQLVELGSAVTYLGEPLDISIDADGDYYVNDVVIVQTDIQAANGVLHVINGLLVPSSAADTIISRTVNPDAESNTGTSDQTLEALAAADTSGQTILEIISSNGGFSTLTAAVDATGLNDALNTGGPITLLAPTNGAFAEIPDLDLESMLNTAPDELTTLLQYHFILDGVTSTDLSRLGTVLSATGDPITATVGNNGVITLNNNAATVYMADIEASNGVIHAISAVLTPPAQ